MLYRPSLLGLCSNWIYSIDSGGSTRIDCIVRYDHVYPILGYGLD
jgi:hypothetical protein